MLRRLPPYLLGHALAYAGRNLLSPTSFVLRLGVVSKSFLEALKYVDFLNVDVVDLLSCRWCDVEHDGRLMSSRYDTRFQRWCEIASARLKNVTYMYDGGYHCNYNVAQTQAIVDAAASFSNLTKLRLFDAEPATLCARLAEHIRAGKFTSLKHLEIANKPSEGIPDTAAVKLHMRDLMSLLPINMALDMHVGGTHYDLYPYLLEEDNEYETWRSELFELIDKGADVVANPILIYMLRDFRFVPCAGENSWGIEHLDASYSVIEALLARGVDPTRSVYGSAAHGESQTALGSVVEGLISNNLYASPSPDQAESLNRMLMRTMDLLLRYGSMDDPTPRLYRHHSMPEYTEDLDVAAWILARPDCTPLLRQDVLRRRDA